MNINRNNYEEFFILYMDDELSFADKKLVETFVNENPDLREEFISLNQTRLVSEIIPFTNKEALLKTGSVINADNYEEYFLLYADNELNADEIREAERFAASTPALQQEFDLIQQARLVPEINIIFPGKSSLYKKQEPRRVIPMPIGVSWMRFAAAAIVAGIILTAGILFFNKKTTGITPDIATKEKPSPALPAQPAEKLVTSPQQTIKQPPVAADNKENKNQLVLQITGKLTPNVKKNKKQVVAVTNQNNIPSSLVKKDDNILKKINESAETKTNNIETGAVVKADAPKKIKANPIEIIDRAVGAETTNENIQTASYYEEDKKTSIGMFSVSDDKVQKSGLRGLFRKVKRLVDRRGNNNEEKDKKIYIGSFAIAVAK